MLIEKSFRSSQSVHIEYSPVPISDAASYHHHVPFTTTKVTLPLDLYLRILFFKLTLYAAFNLCLSLEFRAHLVPLPNPRHPPVVLCARVLGYTLLEVPSVSGNEHMAKSINEVNTDDALLLALANYYIQSLLHIRASVCAMVLTLRISTAL